jgi:ABC-2 type transport system permease protein
MFYYQLKSELWKLFGKKRTYIGFVMLMLAQLLIVILLRFYEPARQSLMSTIDRSGFGGQQYLSMLTMATFLVVMLAYTLLPLYLALVGGEMVSKEVEDGTLRMILARPVSRVRLLGLKWLAAFVFSILLVVVLALGGMLFCGMFFSVGGGLFAQMPDQDFGIFNFADGLRHFLLAHLVMIAKAGTVMSMAFMFSCFKMKPAAAAIMTLSIFLIDRVVMEIPYFHDLKKDFIGYHLNAWQLVLQPHIPWWQVGESLGILFGLSLTFLIIGVSAFQLRDIKS